MKFFDAIFKKKKETETTANTPVSKSKEAQSLKELEGFLQKLQESDHYIARSEYYEQIREYAETVSFAEVILLCPSPTDAEDAGCNV